MPRFQTPLHTLIMTDVHRDGPPVLPLLDGVQSSHLLQARSREHPGSDEMMHNPMRRQILNMRHFSARFPPCVHGGIAYNFHGKRTNENLRTLREEMSVEPLKASAQYSGAEPTIRASEHISTIFVAYHFFPSREVGARRMSALARHLTAQGRAVAVISAFAGLTSIAAESSAGATLAEYDLEHVPDRKSIIDAVLVNGKKWLRSCVSFLPRAKQSPPVESDSAVGRRSQTHSAF